MTKRNYKHYSDELKKKAGELYDVIDAKGNRKHTVKQIAKELHVPYNTALYLQHQGRKLLGTWSRTRKSYKPKKTVEDTTTNIAGLTFLIVLGFVLFAYWFNKVILPTL